MKIWIASGPVGCGKTTRLLHWAETQEGVRGLLSPVVNGNRQFLHLASGTRFSMEAEKGESEVWATPRYRFSIKAFQRVQDLLRQDLLVRPPWFLLDEIGQPFRGDR